MIAYTRRKLQHLIKIDFIRFCIVGGTGFVINFILLALLPKIFGVPIPVAQFVGAEVALFSNFVMHNKWTYKSKYVKKSIANLLIQFHATSWPAILGSTAMVSVGVETLHLSKLIALAISSVIALLWNFGWTRFVIWRDVTPKEIKEIVK
jgi:dolichol-phosphate mannosyltransferase